MAPRRFDAGSTDQGRRRNHQILSRYGVPVELADLADVSAVAPTSGQVLVWNAATQTWEPGSSSGGGSAYRERVIDSSLIGYWPLDEASGTTAFDISGNDNHGTYVGSPALASSGKFLAGSDDQAPVFDGSDDAVILGQPAAMDFDPSSDDFTVGAWCYYTGGGASFAYVVTKATGTAGNRTLVLGKGNADAELYIHVGGGGLDVGDIGTEAPGISDWDDGGGFWMYYAIVVKSGNARVYVNGYDTDPGGNGTTAGSATNATDWIIGARRSDDANTGLSTLWVGSIAHVRVYNRALTGQELRALARGSDEG